MGSSSGEAARRLRCSPVGERSSDSENRKAYRTIFAKGLCERIGLDGKFTYKPQVEGKETIKAADVILPQPWSNFSIGWISSVCFGSDRLSTNGAI